MPLQENTIYCGDNLAVLKGFEDNCVDLFYGDPQFFSNKKYETFWGDAQEIRMFEDVWVKRGEGKYGKDINCYLNFMEERIREVYRVLKPTGSFYLHCDWHADAYLRVLCDQIFGYNNCRRQLIWKYFGPSETGKNYPKKHDIIWFYTKGNEWTFNQSAIMVEPDEKTIKRYDKIDETGLRYKNYLQKDGSYKRSYMPEGKPTEVFEIPFIPNNANERLGYPTQKPEALLEIFIKASSNEGDIVLDSWAGCYDDQTEILTDKGWTFFRNLESEDQVASLDYNRMVMVKPLARQSYHYSGDMHAWKSTRCDLLVTPDHNMYVSERKTFPGLHYDLFRFVKSENVKWLSRIKRNCSGSIQESGTIEIPNKIDPVQWCKFLGLWIGDGSVVSKEAKGYKVDIRQIKTNNHPWIENVLNNIKVYWTKNSGDTRFQFSDREVYEYLEKLGKQPVRRIPRDIILNGSLKMLESMIEGLVISDGTIKKGTKVIYTISRGLCDDIAECFVRLGMAVHITSRQPRTEKHKSSDGRDFWSKSVCYCVTGASVRINYALHKPEVVKYDGMVYCVTVPSHVILVRRNDKIVWCGNCGTTLAVAKRLNRKYVGIDISPTACRLVAKRIGYPVDKIIGLPITAEEITNLTGFEFQNTVIRLLDPSLGTITVGKKGADGGIDGTYYDLVISVKKYKAGRKDLDEFVASIYRNKKKKGIFIALDYSSDFIKEIARLDRDDKIKIYPFTVTDLVQGKHHNIINDENRHHGMMF